MRLQWRPQWLAREEERKWPGPFPLRRSDIGLGLGIAALLTLELGVRCRTKSGSDMHKLALASIARGHHDACPRHGADFSHGQWRRQIVIAQRGDVGGVVEVVAA